VQCRVNEIWERKCRAMSKMRVLIVDDDPALLQALPQAIRLRMKDVEVESSDSAQEALQQVQKKTYDAIVSDIKMPGMDGITMIEQLQHLCPETPTLLITGHGERDLAIRALRVGAYDFIQKPIDRDYFISSLTRAIQTRQMRQKIDDQRRELAQYTQQLEQTVAERTKELVAANSPRMCFWHGLARAEDAADRAQGVAQVLVRRVARGDSLEPQMMILLESSVRRMERLVNDLLDTSQIENGMFTLHCQDTDLAGLVRNVVAEQGAAVEWRSRWRSWRTR